MLNILLAEVIINCVFLNSEAGL